MKTHLKTCFGLLFTILLLGSCAKKDDDVVSNLSGLSIVNASPSFDLLDVYVDQTKVTNDFSDFTFGSKIDYLSVYSGTRFMTLTKKGSREPLSQQSFILAPQYGYTLFVIDKPQNIQLMMLPDNLTKPEKGMASVRFANLSPDSEPLTLSVAGGLDYLITNIAYKQYSNPMMVHANDPLEFQIRSHQTGGLVLSMAGIKLEEGKIYTIYVKGLMEASNETKISSAIYTHK
ncbi:MAG: DUF4397 domain-containing protein [Pedobacter sp.]|nr:MAG: DUF4397 domain-containing protein [Pedobacter sp.]